MSAHTIVSVKELARNGGDGEKLSHVQITGTASYDTGGSVLDLSSYFGDEVRAIIPSTQGTTEYQLTYIPDTGNAPATGKIAVFDGGGTQISAAVDLSGVTYDLLVSGTDV
jgi:hypothetical protein